MLESILYFVLGFLAAALLALMVAPAIWRRAVVLTRRRIEGSVPLTLNEIQADKDQLKAEFAMSTRRLELSVKQLRDKAAEQLIQINRKREELTDLGGESEQKSQNISELEAQGSELRASLRKLDNELDDTTKKLRSTQSALEERSAQLDLVEQRFRAASSESDDQRLELAARETQLQNLTDKVGELGNMRSETSQVAGQLKTEIKSLKRDLKAEKSRSSDIDKRMVKVQATLTDREEKLERRERELARAREKGKNSASNNSSSQAELEQALAEKASLQAELAASCLRTEALLDDASNANVKEALAHMRNEKSVAEELLGEVEGERDELKSELGRLQRAGHKQWEAERRENAVLRERINDLAAQVTAMIALLEGDDSIINEILKENKKPKKKAQESTGAPAGEVTSLADRIRELQLAAGQQSQ